MMAYRVTAKVKHTEEIVAEYIFDKMQDAIKFHSDMVGKGYESVLSRVQV
jgi:hypothetical protein